MTQQDNIGEFEVLLSKLNLNSLLALQVMISKQALRVSLAKGLPEPKVKEKSTLIKPKIIY